MRPKLGKSQIIKVELKRSFPCTIDVCVVSVHPHSRLSTAYVYMVLARRPHTCDSNAGASMGRVRTQHASLQNAGSVGGSASSGAPSRE